MEQRIEAAAAPGRAVVSAGRTTVGRRMYREYPAEVGPPGPTPGRRREWGIRAWMLALPVDLVALALPVLWNADHFRGILTMAGLGVVLLAAGGRYRARLHVSLLDELPSLVGRAFTGAAIVACVIALRHPSDEVSVFLRAAVASMVALVLGRAVTNCVVLTARRRRLVAHPTVIVGAGPIGRELARLLDEYPRYGLQVVAVVDDHRPDLSPVEAATSPVPPSGWIDDLEAVVAAAGADVVLVADPVQPDFELLEPLSRPATAHCDLLVVPRMPDFHTQAGLVDHIGAVPIMRIRRPLLDGPSWLVKRGIDILVSTVALLAVGPIMAICAAAIRIEGGPGVLFRQDRMTRDGRIFRVVKFRTMTGADEAVTGTAWCDVAGDRVTRVGRVLRQTSLDELPQLYNILRGDMTLVGPRPERPHFVAKFSAEHPSYSRRSRVRSGLTGLAQVSGLRGDTSISDRARHDNFYIENWSLWLDVKVLLRTIVEVVRAKGR